MSNDECNACGAVRRAVLITVKGSKDLLSPVNYEDPHICFMCYDGAVNRLDDDEAEDEVRRVVGNRRSGT